MATKKCLFGLFTVIVFCGVFGAVAANAQRNLVRKYVLEQQLDNGQTNRIAFELKDKNVAVYSKVNKAVEESSQKTGSCSWSKSPKLLTITMPTTDGEEKIVVIFKLVGENLKVIKVSPASAGTVGDIFKKI